MTTDEIWTPAIRLVLAVVAGALIGLERTYSGRPAGFRTHALVATASSLLMLFTVFQFRLLSGAPADALKADPTRLAQGIMTGIGFLGAGVIVKEGITVRGLTTAASIWMTAAIGILIGVGLYWAAGIAEFLALGILALFRCLEALVPTLYFARLTVSASPESPLSEADLRKLVTSFGVRMSNFSYGFEGARQTFQFGMTIQTRNPNNFSRLAEGLRNTRRSEDFSIQSAVE